MIVIQFSSPEASVEQKLVELTEIVSGVVDAMGINAFDAAMKAREASRARAASQEAQKAQEAQKPGSDVAAPAEVTPIKSKGRRKAKG